MSRLLFTIAEARADREPPSPLDWFHFPYGFLGSHFMRLKDKDRFLLFLGLDAGLKDINTVDAMVHWFSKFKGTIANIDPNRFSATVFVLDWPKDGTEYSSGSLKDWEIDRLMEAGIYYRPKDPKFYEKSTKSLADSLLDDLMENQLLPEQPELNEAVAPRPAPDLNDPIYRETIEFLGSQQMVWPDEAIHKLLGR
jgi:hypothetical protein